MSLFSLLPANSSTSAQTRKGRVTVSLTRTRSLSRSEISQAETHLSEMGYGKGRDALVAFEKYQGRKVASQLTRDDFNSIMNANAPQARDSGYKHVEVDLDRQVLLLADADGAVKTILPVSTGSDKREAGSEFMRRYPAGENRRSDCFIIQTTSAMDSRFTAILPSLKLHRVTDAFAFPCPRRLRLADHCPRARSC